MPHPLEAGTIRILKPDGSTAGTGFLVSKRLAVTCAHVVESASAKPGDKIQFEYHLGNIDVQEALTLKDGWSSENDVAILELTTQPPKWIHPIIMQSSRAMEGRSFQGLGYPDDGPVQTRWPQGNISGRVDVREYTDSLLQIQGKEIDKGISGSAIVDRTTRRVIGMLTAYQDISRQGKTESVRFGYAIPIETIWKVYPELEKELPLLPKRSPLVEGIHLLPNGYDFRIQNFLSEYLGTPEQPEPFGGREDALKQLDVWLDGDTQRLLLAAPAGRGKSALLVRWIDRLISRDDLALVFIPVSVRFRTNLSSTFFASLGARLAYLHGEDVPTSDTTSVDVWRGLASTYLTKPLADDRKLLIVLDGLDEAGDWEATADLVPAELPKNVRVVVSARFLAGDLEGDPWLARLGWEHTGKASTIELDPLDTNGVSDVLFRMGVPLDKISNRLDIVSELHRLSEGDPLLVNLYVEDLWSRGGEASRFQPEDLRTIKPGYEGYFDRWWTDQKKLWGKEAPLREKSVRLVFNLLCGAFGGLTKDELSVLDTEHELDSYSIEDALDSLKRFVIGIPNERKGKIGYVLTHPKLRDYFWEKLLKKEQGKLEECFLSWGEQTLQKMIEGKINPKERAEIPVYIIQYYGVHLDRGKQPIEKWLPLIHHQQWAQAWFTVEGAYGGYLQDVERIWQNCKQLDQQTVRITGKAHYLDKQIRCALIEASLHSQAAEIPPKLIWPLVRDGIWTWPQIWAFIRQMPNTKQQAEAIAVLTSHLHNDQLATAIQVTREIRSETNRSRALCVLIERLPELGMEALETVGLIENESDRAEVLSNLAERVPKSLLEQVLQFVRALEHETDRAGVFGVLVRRLPEVSREALHVARVLWSTSIFRTDNRTKERNTQERTPADGMIFLQHFFQSMVAEEKCVELLSRLAETVAGSELREVLQAARAMRDEKGSSSNFLHNYYSAKVLSALVLRLPELGDEALEASYTLLEDHRAEVLSVLAQNMPESALQGVLKAVRSLRNKWYQGKVLSILMRRLPEVREEALNVIDLLDNRWRYGSWRDGEDISKLLQHLPELGENILPFVFMIQDENYLAEALNVLVEYLQESSLENVVETIRVKLHGKNRVLVLSALAQRRPEVSREALESTRFIRDEKVHIEFLSSLVQHLPERELDRVIEETRAMKAGWGFAKVLSMLVQRLPGTIGDALKAVRGIGDEGDRADVLSVLAQKLPEGVLSYIFEAACDLKNDFDRAKVLSILVKRLPEVRKVREEALRTMWALRDERERTKVLSILAQAMPERKLGQLLETARKLINERDRAEVLRALAQYMPVGELGQVLAEAQAITDSLFRNKVLSALVFRLPEVSNEDLIAATITLNTKDRIEVTRFLVRRMSVEGIGQVIETVRVNQNETFRAVSLSALLQHRPELSREALEAARSIRDVNTRAIVLTSLVQSLPEAIGEALIAVQAIRIKEENNLYNPFGQPTDQEIRAECLSTLVNAMLHLHPEKHYAHLEVLVTNCSRNTRANLASYLIALMPVIVQLGADDTPGGIYEAIRDVTTWWP